jgi:threonine/homoserine/homoserine lactone efflux protein
MLVPPGAQENAAMETFAVYFAISTAILLGAMSPGPSFIVVARVAVAGSRLQGVLAALGMGLGGSLFALAALLGLQLVLLAVPSIYRLLQVLGALYLLFLAYKLWRASSSPLDLKDGTAGHSSGLQALAVGLTTQLSNPKAAIVYASVFSAALPRDSSWLLTALLVPTIFAIEFGWYTLVALAFSGSRARASYARGKRWIDRLAAGAMGMLGVKILAETRAG